jgi:ArsR family transcriptional regulator
VGYPAGSGAVHPPRASRSAATGSTSNAHGEKTRTWPHSRMLAPTAAPRSKTIGCRPRPIRCAAAASPTGPALADRHRVKILNRLLAAGGEPVCVCDFEDMLGLKQSTTSYHLKQLLDAGIVVRERRGKFAYFSVTSGALERIRELLSVAA